MQYINTVITINTDPLICHITLVCYEDPVLVLVRVLSKREFLRLVVEIQCSKVKLLLTRLICAIQLRMDTNERRSVTSNTNIIPWAPLKYDAVIVRNRSCPAVSHI